MAQIVKSELWAKYIAEFTRGKHVPSLFEVNQRLDEDDLRDLGRLLLSEAGPQRNAALQLLLMRYMNGGFANKPELARSFCPALHGIVTESYPLGEPGQQAMTLWIRIELESAAEFLNGWVDKNGIPEAVATRVTLDLSFGNKESFARLRRFAEKNPQATLASHALLILERTAPDWPERLKEYGRQWREKRDCRTLLHLTNQLVDLHPREDAYIGPILETLGEPDGVVDRCYTYSTKEEFHGSLFLVTDEQGKITGWKLDNC